MEECGRAPGEMEKGRGKKSLPKEGYFFIHKAREKVELLNEKVVEKNAVTHYN